ncbi:amino acid/amide ABC transporter membrane protein 2, HAAT family (TC 3.A.1.4.-) [Polaromonas sp. OV174]|uniref:branched-chain amino acid ABC transporter permease n=1 Tax=Polaromonas sp. OV174 TaxID=1855300 RepID=UPI0008E41F3E|nr:branched-chain amino acid ABC transporter permease [Polaromonas sp. OV174]SFC52450.1 amino acid/amide ABC transporter membrane protein 2, HAAT family (TC 3.A.1.4.-) [Polaromonas sp. OV174]
MRIGDFRESYEHDQSIWSTPVQRAWLALLAGALVIFPFSVNDYLVSVACLLGIHVIATTGLNIMTGYTGLISLGHAAFMGVGCYTAAYLAQRGVPFFVTLPLAGAMAAVLGLLVGLPSLRIKGLYLAVATLATQFILVYVFREWDSVTGGVRGVNVPNASLFGFELLNDQRMYFLIVPVAVLLLVAARNLFRTRVGRAFIAIRDKDISAEVLGINLLRYKLAAFAIGSFYAGVAGALLGYFYRAMTPEYFTLTLSIFYLAAIIVGGLGSLLGTILGAVFMTLVPELLRAAATIATRWSPGATEILSSMQQVVFGLLIIAFLVFEPHGLLEVWRRVRRFFHLWPFRA